MAGWCVHRLGSRQGFEGAIVGIWAYQDEHNTYGMALQVSMRWKHVLHLFGATVTQNGAADAQLLLDTADDSRQSRG